MMYHFSTLYINPYIFIILYNTFLYNKKMYHYIIYISKNNIKIFKKVLTNIKRYDIIYTSNKQHFTA